MKSKELKSMSKNDREKRLKELRLELVKSRSANSKTNTRDIKRIIARILTLNKSEESEEVGKHK